MNNQDVGLGHADVVLKDQAAAAARRRCTQPRMIEFQVPGLVDAGHKRRDECPVVVTDAIDICAVDCFGSKLLLEVVQPLVQVHHQEMQTVGYIALAGHDVIQVPASDAIIVETGGLSQQRLQSRCEVFIRTRQTPLGTAFSAVELGRHPLDFINQAAVDPSGRWNAIQISGFPPSAATTRSGSSSARAQANRSCRRSVNGSSGWSACVRAACSSDIRYFARSLAASASLTSAEQQQFALAQLFDDFCFRRRFKSRQATAIGGQLAFVRHPVACPHASNRIKMLEHFSSYSSRTNRMSPQRSKRPCWQA